MHIFHSLTEIPADFGPTLVSVGNFDGVHPARILRPESGLKLLTPTAEKLRLLEATGVDAVLLLPFGRDLSLMTPREFAERILKKRLHASEVHEGFNFRFG